MRHAISFQPGLARILRDRRFGLFLTGALSLNLIAFFLHFPGWQCAFFRLTGVPCPGCGLTRACILLLSGDVHTSLRFHAFAPIFVVLIALMITCTVLPRSVTEPFIKKAETLEQQTGITTIIFVGLILYWFARLLLFPSAFVPLVRG